MEAPLGTAPLAPPAPEVDLRITHVRGPMTRQVREAVLRTEGEAGWQRLLAGVSPACRECFSRDLGPFEWVDAALSVELSLAYQARLGPGFLRERGREAAQAQMSTFQRWFLKLVTPPTLLEHLPRLMGFYYQGGRVVLDHMEPGSARISLWASGMYPDWFAHGLPGWLHTMLEAMGARRVVITYQPPPGEGAKACRHAYEVSWER